MKKQRIKDIFFLFVVVTYSLQAILKGTSGAYIYASGVIVSTALLYVIKNKYLGFLAGLAVLAAMELYDPYCKYITVLPFLLVSSHKNLVSGVQDSDKNKKNKTDAFPTVIMQFCLFAGIALFIYSLFLSFEDQSGRVAFHLNRTVFVYLWLIGLLIYSVFDKHNKKTFKKNSKQLSGNLQFLYFVGIIAFSAAALFSYAERWIISFSYNVVFLPWFVFICAMVYNGDPNIEAAAERIEKFLVRISKSDKVKK